MFSLVRFVYRLLTLSKHISISVLGLDNAGKTCFLNSVRMLFGMDGAERIFPSTGQSIVRGKPRHDLVRTTGHTSPPASPNVRHSDALASPPNDAVLLGSRGNTTMVSSISDPVSFDSSIDFSVVDVSGKLGYRKFWVQLFNNAHVIVWMVDVSMPGRARWEESKIELNKILFDSRLHHAALCIVASKWDTEYEYLDNVLTSIIPAGSNSLRNSSIRSSSSSSSIIEPINAEPLATELQRFFEVEELAKLRPVRIFFSKCPVNQTREGHAGPEAVFSWLSKLANEKADDARLGMRMLYVKAHENQDGEEPTGDRKDNHQPQPPASSLALPPSVGD